jgi:iron complex transport system ATP-binding protein
MSDLLEAIGLGFSYGDQQALVGVDVRLSGGEVVALLGPNGSGKSTLLRVLLGQLRGEGKARWDGREVGRWKPAELARRVAYLPQSPAWEAWQRVEEVVALGRAPYWGAFGTESAEDARVIAEVIDLLEIRPFCRRRMDEISGGQRQRVFLARCLAQQPAAMLLDEPGTFLDLRHQVETAGLLDRLAKERGVGILMASHDLNLAADVADRMMVLHEGKLAAQGTPDQIMRPELLGPIYGLEMERAGHRVFPK